MTASGRATGHCLVAISSPGYGHLAQVAPVLNQFAPEIQANNRSIRFSLRTTLPAQQIAQRVRGPFALDAASDDFGMQMRNAFESDLPASLQRYQALHTDWTMHVERVAEHLSEQAVDLVFADVPYLTLAGAKIAGITSVAMCSLNWADILEQSVRADPAALQQAGMSMQTLERVLQTMRDAYAGAAVFLQPTPSMPMSVLSNAQAIGVVGDRPPPVSRQQLIEQVRQSHQTQQSHQSAFEHAADGWFVLVSMGGIPTELQPKNWPTHCLGRPVYYWVTPALAGQHPHALVLSAHAPSYQTLIAASDVVLTKPGYGIFVEACAAGTPLLYVSRPDWPESEALTHWVSENGHGQAISPSEFSAGQFEQALAALLTRGRSEPIALTGAARAADVLRVLSDCPSTGVAEALAGLRRQ